MTLLKQLETRDNYMTPDLDLTQVTQDLFPVSDLRLSSDLSRMTRDLTRNDGKPHSDMSLISESSLKQVETLDLTLF